MSLMRKFSITRLRAVGTCLVSLVLAAVSTLQSAQAQVVLGDEPSLGPIESRTTQEELANGSMSLTEIRRAGLKMFATQFRHSDGFGDGPINPADKLSPGGRPTLQGNGSFLRVNGLDAQACQDCHSIVSADTVPTTLGIGGAGGIKDSAMFMTRAIDVEDVIGQGEAGFDGRLINPPALYGTGGVQLVAKEMTIKLQRQRTQALLNPGRPVSLRANGVYFGIITADAAGNVDTSRVEGIDEDLVVRPFGRKGEFATVRGFDLGALRFHMGMEPVEVVGENVDGDGDGVVNEVLTGEVSALEIFVTTQESPIELPMDSYARSGWLQFNAIGCIDCHRPSMRTTTSILTYSQPEVPTDPTQNVFYSVDLAAAPSAFRQGPGGWLIIPMLSDLKRHDMGDELAESFHDNTDAGNREFITAKLWGVADTAPYLHDGRAHSLNEAIMLHGGEAKEIRDAYAALEIDEKNALLSFLRTLRNPVNPNSDVQ